MRLSRLVLLVLPALLACAFAAPAMAAPPPTLDGVKLDRTGAPNTLVTGVCGGGDFRSPYHFDADGTPVSGPYRGNAAWSGDLDLESAQEPDSDRINATSRISDAGLGDARVTINAQVPELEVRDNVCGGTSLSFDGTAPYTAVLTAPDRSLYRDSGRVDLIVEKNTSTVPAPLADRVAETFHSSQAAPQPVDDDNDGANDGIDNCLNKPNPGQADQDRDGKGDACDDDIDGDGVGNGTDNCATTSNPGQADQDRDGKGDACDDDIDGDGVGNGTDNCATVKNPGQEDFDRDGKGDACDSDVISPTGAALGSGVTFSGGDIFAFAFAIRATTKSVTGDCEIQSTRVTIRCASFSSFRRNSAGKAVVLGKAYVNGKLQDVRLTIEDNVRFFGSGRDSFVVETGGKSYMGTIGIGDVQVGA